MVTSPKKKRQGKYGHIKRGKRADLADGNTYRSGWEADMARILNLWKDNGYVNSWVYEPHSFSFMEHYNSNPLFYKPDFLVEYDKRMNKKHREFWACIGDIFEHVIPGGRVYLEVKGQMKSSDREKIRRFRRVTNNKLEVVDRHKLYLLQQEFKDEIPKWESTVRK